MLARFCSVGKTEQNHLTCLFIKKEVLYQLRSPLSCLEDFQHFEKAMREPKNNDGKPIEPFSSTFRALCGGLKEVPIPEELLETRQEITQLLALVQRLDDRNR